MAVLAKFSVIHGFEDWKNFLEKKLFLKVHYRFTTCLKRSVTIPLFQKYFKLMERKERGYREISILVEIENFKY